MSRIPIITCMLVLAYSASFAVSPVAHGGDAVEAPDFSSAGAAPIIESLAAIVDAPSTPTAPPAPAAPTPNGGWLDVSTWPLIPVPEIAVDPDSGTTLGILPTWLHTNDQREITRIIAPDLTHNPYFGLGAHFRIFEYPSTDEQWNIVAGVQQRVQRSFDYEFQKGRLRDSNWSINTSLIFDRSGTPRFYGIGNGSLLSDETNYTASQMLAQAQFGYNLNHTWQLQYTTRARRMEITEGTLAKIPTIQTRYPQVHGLGTTDEVLNQVALVYDTRDDTTIPTRGTQWVAYAGVNGHNATISDSIYSMAGIDARTFIPLSFLPDTTLAAHAAIRYLPSGHEIPFYDLSSIGGGESDIAGQQMLRGFGQGRFVDRNSYSATFEFRHRAFSFDAAASHVDIEVAPFVDLGRVASNIGVDPFSALHKVIGVGVRGIARPSVVGYVDIGYGTEGTAVFTGINYPF
ncbi:MAG TPA: BamA/TamA family outer membrane protein [Steroidobacteraceae bacterium]|nr:BamA/TamA family outer membrane protein [Steroidobacteraceae bacterium]